MCHQADLPPCSLTHRCGVMRFLHHPRQSRYTICRRGSAAQAPRYRVSKVPRRVGSLKFSFPHEQGQLYRESSIWLGFVQSYSCSNRSRYVTLPKDLVRSAVKDCERYLALMGVPGSAPPKKSAIDEE